MSRGGISYEGIYSPSDFIPAKADTALKAIQHISGNAAVEGKAVAITGDAEVGFGNAGDPIYGKLEKYEDDDNVTVQVGGYATLPGVSGSLPTASNSVVVDGSGSVSADANASIGGAKAVSVNTTQNTVVVLIG